MKKTVLFFASFIICMLAFAGAPTTISVNSTAGGLASAITSAGASLSTVTNLSVTGSIDARDFKTMRDDMPVLADIDLSGASVDAYIGFGGTDYSSASYLANEIPYRAFDSKKTLKTVTLPKMVISIENYALGHCSNLTSVLIPNTVTDISGYAFYDCTSLALVKIPASVLNSFEYSFPNTCTFDVDAANPNFSTQDGVLYNKDKSKLIKCPTAKVGSLIVPSSVTSIEIYAFSGCTGLTSVEIPNSVTSIGYSAFEGCSGLTSIVIPNSVTSIGNYAFNGCTGLTSIEIPNSVTSIVDYTFSGCTGLSSVEIPNSVTSIENYTFQGCTGLTSVDIPNSVTSIGQSAFEGCIGLTSVAIPNTVKSISYSAFRGCTGLTSIVIPNSVTSIRYSAFEGCSGLTSIEIPNSVTSIQSSAFEGCTGLSSVTIPSSVTSIDYRAFGGISNANFYITSSKIDISPSAFVMSNNSNIYIDCDTLTLWPYGHSGFQNNLFISAKTVEINNPIGLKGLADKYEIDASNNSYSTDGLVVYNKNKTELLVASTRCIDAYEIPSTVTTIKAAAFAYCDSLTSVIIPASVTAIGDTAFYGCSGLKSIYSYSVVPPALSYTLFYGPDPFCGIDTSNCILYVPKGTKVAYKSTRYWQGFQNIVEMDDNTASANDASFANVKAVVKQGKLELSGLDAKADVAIYNMQGIELASAKATDDALSIDLPARGVYVVRVGKQSIKVLY